MAQFYRADITLLHVLSRSVQSQPDADRVVEWTKSEIRRIIPDEAALWTHTSVQVEIGDVVEEVLNVAAEQTADLIVLGVDANVSFWPIRGDDTVYSIIAQAKVPVLSLRHLDRNGDVAPAEKELFGALGNSCPLKLASGHASHCIRARPPSGPCPRRAILRASVPACRKTEEAPV